MVAATTPPTLKPYHFLALRKALDALTADQAAGRDQSAGWRHGPDVHGWRVADELVALGLLERSLDGVTNPRDLQKQRYRLTDAGRSAYRATPVETNILMNLWTALNEAVQSGHTTGGWRHWNTVATSWGICDELVAKGWLQHDLKSGPQRKNLGNRKYKITRDGCQIIGLPFPPDEKDKAAMNQLLQIGTMVTDGKIMGTITAVAGDLISVMDNDGELYRLPASSVHIIPPVDDPADLPAELPDDWTNRRVDPETGEIITIAPASAVENEDLDDKLREYERKIAEEERAALSNPDGLQPIDLDDYLAAIEDDQPAAPDKPANQSADTDELVALVEKLQNTLLLTRDEITDLSKAKFTAEREAKEARDALAKATALPKADEFTALQRRAEEQRVEINQLRLRLNTAESAGWKAKAEKAEKENQKLTDELAQLRQPSLLSDPLPVAIMLDGQSVPVDDVLEELFDLRRERQEQQRQLQIEQRKRRAAEQQRDTARATAASTTLEIETEFLIGDTHNSTSRANLTATLNARLREGWRVAYETIVVSPMGGYYARLERNKPAADPDPDETNSKIDQAIAEALATPALTTGPEILILGLDPEPEPVTTGDPFRDALRSGITDPATLAAIGNQQLLNIAETAFNRVAAAPAPSRPFKPFALLTVKD